MGRTVRVEPARGPLDAVVVVPGSKSIANRALVCAAQAAGASTVTGVPDGDDSEAMIDCLQALGVPTQRSDDGAVIVDGGVARFRRGPIVLDARLAGTTSRFVTALAVLGPGPYTIDGAAPLRGRPMQGLHDALRSLGASIEPAAGAEPGHLPVTVRGPLAGARSTVTMPGDVTSQYLSALMMIAPALPTGLRIELSSVLVSRPYVSITAGVMADFGVPDVDIADDHIAVATGAYVPCSTTVEPDASSASYPLAAAAVCGGRVHVAGLTPSSRQGDTAFADLLASMGCAITRDAGGTTIERVGELRGIDVDMADISDLVPTLAAVAPYAMTPTTIRGVGFIRRKESDRIGDLCEELRRAGVDVTETADGMVIAPSSPRGVVLHTHHDHRLAMAFAVLGLGLRADSGAIDVADADVVGKSWPSFWSMIASLR